MPSETRRTIPKEKRATSACPLSSPTQTEAANLMLMGVCRTSMQKKKKIKISKLFCSFFPTSRKSSLFLMLVSAENEENKDRCAAAFLLGAHSWMWQATPGKGHIFKHFTLTEIRFPTMRGEWVLLRLNNGEQDEKRSIVGVFNIASISEWDRERDKRALQRHEEGRFGKRKGDKSCTVAKNTTWQTGQRVSEATVAPRALEANIHLD